MDGYTATREMRRYEQQAGMSATPVLALTAHAFSDMAEKGRDAGFTAHLVKPVRKATLLEAIALHAGLARPAGEVQEKAAPEAPADELVVQVEQGMEDVVPGYLEKRRKDVDLYRQALAAGDFDAVRMLGHKMKGTGAGYGFPVLTEIGDAIEQAALKKDAGSVAAQVDRLAWYAGRVKLEYAQ
jgi:HPt (histidine-containing phosphotransfer) domain-containing protein